MKMVVSLIMLISNSGSFGDVRNARNFAWSPDSQNIIYDGDMEVDGKMELYTTGATDANFTKVSGPAESYTDVLQFLW